uniref:Annexin D3 n=1 Tax=Rhizophora mucronata TaxID=61149 RepID=A0A2P2KDS3_RHIMU
MKQKLKQALRESQIVLPSKVIKKCLWSPEVWPITVSSRLLWNMLKYSPLIFIRSTSALVTIALVSESSSVPFPMTSAMCFSGESMQEITFINIDSI